jgi:hypothetical protein
MHTRNAEKITVLRTIRIAYYNFVWNLILSCTIAKIKELSHDQRRITNSQGDKSEMN